MNHLLWSYVGQCGGNTLRKSTKHPFLFSASTFQLISDKQSGRVFVTTLNKNQVPAPPIEAEIILWLAHPPLCYCGNVQSRGGIEVRHSTREIKMKQTKSQGYQQRWIGNLRKTRKSKKTTFSSCQQTATLFSFMGHGQLRILQTSISE